MMNRLTLYSLELLATLLPAVLSAAPADEPAAAAPPPERPAQGEVWAAELRAQSEPGEPLALEAGGEEPVFALYRPEQRGEPKGGLVLLHDVGAHPDWPGVIAPLRRQLPHHGWHTLSLQLPPPPATSEEEPAWHQTGAARVAAALTYLKGRNVHNLVLAAHGRGAEAALAYLVGKTGAEVRGLVLIGTAGLPPEQAKQLAALELPVLELYGSIDRAEVLNAARRRAQLPHPPGRYRQRQLPGADHELSGQQIWLVRQVRGWLKTRAQGMALPARR